METKANYNSLVKINSWNALKKVITKNNVDFDFDFFTLVWKIALLCSKIGDGSQENFKTVRLRQRHTETLVFNPKMSVTV